MERGREFVCFKGRKSQRASNGDRVFRVIGQRGCQDVMLDRGLLVSA